MFLTIPVLNFTATAVTTTQTPITSVGLDFSSITSNWTGTGSHEGVNRDLDSKTLTLTNANVYGNDNSLGDCYGINVPGDTTIILNGNSIVTGGVSTNNSFGIYGGYGYLNIQGDGSLSVTSCTATNNAYGIYVPFCQVISIHFFKKSS